MLYLGGNLVVPRMSGTRSADEYCYCILVLLHDCHALCSLQLLPIDT